MMSLSVSSEGSTTNGADEGTSPWEEVGTANGMLSDGGAKGAILGTLLGSELGELLGVQLGKPLGARLGEPLGARLGTSLGAVLGKSLGV